MDGEAKTCILGILKHVIQLLVTPYKEDDKKKKTSRIKEERDEISGAIRYIKLSEYYDKFDECKEKTKEISRHKRILTYLTKKWVIPKY